MKESPKIKLPNGDTIPVPDGSNITYTKDAIVVKTQNGDIIKEFFNGKHVQMMSKLQGYEIQTDWIGRGIIRKAWDKDGNLRFRVATRNNHSESISHETCYQDNKLRSICLTMLSLLTLKSMHIAKKDGKVYFVDPTSWIDSDPKNEITDFPKNKRLTSIRSINQFIQEITQQKMKENE